MHSKWRATFAVWLIVSVSAVEAGPAVEVPPAGVGEIGGNHTPIGIQTQGIGAGSQWTTIQTQNFGGVNTDITSGGAGSSESSTTSGSDSEYATASRELHETFNQGAWTFHVLEKARGDR